MNTQNWAFIFLRSITDPPNLILQSSNTFYTHVRNNLTITSSNLGLVIFLQWFLALGFSNIPKEKGHRCHKILQRLRAETGKLGLTDDYSWRRGRANRKASYSTSFRKCRRTDFLECSDNDVTIDMQTKSWSGIGPHENEHLVAIAWTRHYAKCFASSFSLNPPSNSVM